MTTTATSPAAAQPRGNVRNLVAECVDRAVPHAVLEALRMITTRFTEPLSLDMIAAEVFVSPFHFTRIFAKATGTTPGRYLSAVRMFEAKRLLLTTEATVSDVVCAVGYSSVGTFTTRFTAAVGMTPSQFRNPAVRDLLLAVAPHFQRLPSRAALQEAATARSAEPAVGSTVTVRAVLDRDIQSADLIVGVFADPLPQCAPVAWAAVSGTGTATLPVPGVPAGRWTVLAAAEHNRADGSVVPLIGVLPSSFIVGDHEEVLLRLRMRALRPSDPPVAITFAPAVDRLHAPVVAVRAA